MKCTPNIRFKDFEGEWNSYNFGKCFTFLKNNTLSRAELTCIGGSIQNIHYGDVLVKFGSVLNVATESLPYVADESRVQKNNNVLLKNGDIIIADTAEDTTVGKCSEVQGIDGNNVVSGLHTMPVRPLENFAAGYLGYFMNAPAYHDSIIPLIQGTKVSSISRSTITNSRLSSPSSIDEQQQIASFFDSLDTLISKREKEVEKMRNIKRALLEKMFPQQGESVPQIRFGEFKDKWGEKKLGEITTKCTKKNIENCYSETFTNSAEYGIISQRDFFDHDITNAKNIGGYYIVENDDFVYNPRVSVSAPVGPINRNKLGRSGVISPLYTIFRPHDVDYGYLEWFFKGKTWHIFMKKNGNSGARLDRFSINDNVFWTMPISCPKKQEQTKIAKLLQTLDDTISARDRQVTLLKNMKRALLEQMFVNN